MQIVFDRYFMGCGPFTSNAFVATETLSTLGIEQDKRYIVTLAPYYKKGGESMYVNVYPEGDKFTRKEELLYKTGAKVKVWKTRTGIGVRVSAMAYGTTGAADVGRLCNFVEQATVVTPSLGTRVLEFMSWPDLLALAQPIQNSDWLKSLPPSTYRSLAQRWTGLDSDSSPKKIGECIDAIMNTLPSSGVYHPGWINASVNGNPFESSGGMVPTPALVPPTPATPAPAPAAASTLPPMPSSGDSITAQIDALTKRAEAASSLAERVDNLVIEIEQLKNRPQVVIRSGPNFTGSGKVSIGGTELPHFDIAMMGEWSVPEISPTYDIDGWLARFECGDLKRDFTLGQVMRGIMTGTPTRLIGPPATGKTSGIMQACAHMGVPARVIQCGKGLTEYTLLGEQTIEAGSVVWKDGTLPTLCRSVNPDAPAVIVFDEIDHLTAPIQSLLHGVLEGRTLDLPNGEKISIPENVICVATANTYGTGDITGRHAAASVSDDAFISRWTRTFSVEYLNPTAERELLLSYGVPDTKINGLMKFVIGTRDQAKQIDRGDISDGIRTPVTLRTLIPMAQECASGGDFVDAFVTTVMGQFSPDEMPKVRELVRSTMAF